MMAPQIYTQKIEVEIYFQINDFEVFQYNMYKDSRKRITLYNTKMLFSNCMSKL